MFDKKLVEEFIKNILWDLKIKNEWELIESVIVEKLNNKSNNDSPKKKKNNQNKNNK